MPRGRIAAATRGRMAAVGASAALLAGLVSVPVLVTASPAYAFSQPYPNSQFISGFSSSEASKQRYADGSDIWAPTETSDGNLLAVWGDGNGFSSPSKVFIGMSKLSGTPTSGFTGTDMYYGTQSALGCAGGTGTLTGKPSGLIALPHNIVWMTFWDQSSCRGWPKPTRLAESTTNGSSWKVIPGVSWPDSYGMYPEDFVQYGRADQGTLGGYVYLYMYNPGNDPTLKYAYLVRMRPDQVGTPSAYQWYTGTDPNSDPVWGAEASAAPVFTNNDGVVWPIVTFDKAIGRYVDQSNFGDGYEREMGMFDAPTPWGPWTTFDYEDNWDNTNCGSNCLGNGAQLSLFLPQSWMSSDGLNMWGTYSSTGPDLADGTGPVPGYDSLNIIDSTISLGSAASVKGIAVSTDTPAVTDQLSLSGTGSGEFVDRNYHFTSIPSAYVGDEVIRLADSDAASHDPHSLTFTLTKSENVCVAWDSTAAPPAWLSGWSNTGNSLVGTKTFDVYRKAYSAGTVTLGGANSPGGDNYVPFVGC